MHDPHSQTVFAPIHFIYAHLHNAIRTELDELGANVQLLEPNVQKGKPHQVEQKLAALKKSYTFLSHIYKYHSYVEDEVIYPALDGKVRNVTLAYRVEHEDEERLFVQLILLISHALTQPDGQQANSIREFVCKAGEVHTMLRKHLLKEEEQLLPLLLQHFSNKEQACLIAQSLCCIPLAMVTAVLAWMKGSMPLQEQRQLLAQVQQAMSYDRPLLQLLMAWLGNCSTPEQPEGSTQLTAAHVRGPAIATACGPPSQSALHRRAQPHIQPGLLEQEGAVEAAVLPGAGSLQQHRRERDSNDGHAAPTKRRAVDAGLGAPAAVPVVTQREDGSSVIYKPPLRDILYLHEAIRGALDAFVVDAQALTQQGTVTSAQLSALVDKHRFLRAICTCHSASEEEFMFPAARQLTSCPSDAESNTAGLPELCDECEEEHAEEASLFEGLGRLLGDVKASTRRGAREAAALTEELCRCALAVRDAIGLHLRKEECQVLPILETHLEPQEQRAMVWHSLRAMPLRLLERVVPWMAGTLGPDEVDDLVNNFRLAAPLEEAALVELLSRWTHNAARVTETPFASAASIQPGALAVGTMGVSQSGVPPSSAGAVAAGFRPCDSTITSSTNIEVPATSLACADGDTAVHARLTVLAGTLPRLKTNDPALPTAMASSLFTSAASLPVPFSAPTTPTTPTAIDPTAHRLALGISQPIDHIFQFHKALRRELKSLEAAAMALDAAVLSADCWDFDQAVQDLEGRFTFLWGIYQAHSRAEDDIVFPALEEKEATHNISHAYALDHQQEGQLFAQVEVLFQQLRAETDLGTQRSYVSQLRRMCASIRASLETHVRAEENELWPVFVEHFTVDEQQALVGQIIGRTGAEVLQVMLPWVTGSFTVEEEEAMMRSLRTATKNTMFNHWLDAVGSRGRMERSAGSGQILSALQDAPCGIAAAGSGDTIKRGSLSASGEAAQVGNLSGSLPGDAALDPLVLRDMARYIRDQQHGALGDSPETSGAVKDNREYRPGWDDIFRMNEQQLQGAIRRVCGDPNMEPARKSYIVQHIMTSRYIASQQRRMAAMYGMTAIEDAASTAPCEGVEPAVTMPLHAVPPSAATAKHAAAAATGPSCVHAMQSDTVHIARFSEEAAHSKLTASPPCRTVDAVAGATLNAQPFVKQHRPLQQSFGCTAEHSGPIAPLPHTTFHDTVRRTLGCRHYKRAAKLVAPCCGREFTCRLCHDDCIPDHKMDRYTVAEMRCMHCGTRQAVAASCSNCQEVLARYYCDICHLFDDEPGRDIYHCPFCNVCRRGKGLGVDFFHCMTCNSCMSLELHKKHACREKSLECSCPVCSDYLFDSNLAVKELPCGHFMHSTCFAAYTRHSYTCPVCTRSLGDMRVYWRMLDSLLEAERDSLPAAYANRRQNILCNDCGQNAEAPFHFVYHRCPHCTSYNTRVTGN